MGIKKVSAAYIKLLLFFHLLCCTMVSLAQVSYRLTSINLLPASLDNHAEGGLYILKQNELYSVVKFNHSGYGPNSKTYDLLFFDKQALQLNVLIAFADMESNLIEVAGIELHGDTVEVIGSRFLQKDNRRTAFKMHFVKGKLLNDVQTAFPPEPPLPPKYEYFDGYECIGKLGDSAFAFSHRKIFATVSPWTQVSYFNERKVYTYDYLKKDLKTYEFPRFGNSNKKVYEEVQFTQDSFRVTGLYVDTFQTNTKITGIYYSDLYSQTMSYCPIKQLSDTQWVEKGIDEELAWNKNTFNLNNCIIDIHELSDQNLLIACYRPKVWHGQKNSSTIQPAGLIQTIRK